LTIKYDRAMIYLIQEIRKSVNSNDKPDIKLANPHLLDNLRAIYLSSNNVVLKALIKELCFLAGVELLEQSTQIVESESTIEKVYRGFDVLAALAPQLNESSTKKVKMYRGHPVFE